MEHQFKIGDRVRVIDHRPIDCYERPGWTDLMDRYAGKEGIVESLSKSSIEVRLEPGVLCFYKPSWLELIPAKEGSLLKVGDCVKVLRDNGFFSAGTTLIIERVDSNDPSLPYRAGGWWFKKDEVELVTPGYVEPMRISTPWIDAIKDLFGASSSKEPTAKIPLISKTKLLTTIKLD